MGLTRYPHGLSSFGIPLPDGGRFSSPWNTTYFVDGDNGNDGNVGTEPTRSFKTIQKAVNASTGGDVIYIRPKQYKNATGFQRYTEDVTVSIAGTGASAAIEPNALKSIIGVTPRPVPTDYLGVRWTFSSATPLTNNVPGTHIENIGFFVEGATYAINLVGSASGLTMGATGVSIYNCAIKGDGKIVCLLGCDEIQIVNCRFQTKYDGTTGGINLVGSTAQCKRPIIRGCEFIGGNANNMATAPITTAAPVWDMVIRDCYFNAVPDSTYYIQIVGSNNSGIVANCHFGAADVNAELSGLVNGSSGAYATAMYDQVGIDDMSS